MKIRRKYTNWIWGFVFIAPTVIGLYVFFLYPMVNSIYISLTKWNHLTKPEFIGFENYRRLFSDPTILREFFNTFFFVFTMVPLIIIVSLLLANTLNRRTNLTGFFRTVFFLPYVLLPVVTAQVWMIMFNSRYGLINTILGIFDLPQPVWMSDQWLVRMIIVLVGLWANVGYYAVIILAGLQNIADQYYEAAELEGATPRQKFFRITIPLVTPQLFFAAIIAMITIFKMFDYIFIFGKSNDFVRESIRTMAYGIYERGFTYLEMGYASAEAMILCVIVLAITIIQNIGQKKWVHYS
ncbi:carbohydrate ABC transporter permease [Breznakiella homolactica]|uniref:Sugar ABC transporter permease n=1 Tax=Breznakiella homolactica TaxID=2798577 RepID=A0A7T8BAG4_9SPIR|nr:sugar ABC transporter permease [Breznakiella homolactica]QQO08193.1 sugar ABC transporter permease [Breznakiella homolactica]